MANCNTFRKFVSRNLKITTSVLLDLQKIKKGLKQSVLKGPKVKFFGLVPSILKILNDVRNLAITLQLIYLLMLAVYRFTLDFMVWNILISIENNPINPYEENFVPPLWWNNSILVLFWTCPSSRLQWFVESKKTREYSFKKKQIICLEKEVYSKCDIRRWTTYPDVKWRTSKIVRLS